MVSRSLGRIGGGTEVSPSSHLRRGFTPASWPCVLSITHLQVKNLETVDRNTHGDKSVYRASFAHPDRMHLAGGYSPTASSCKSASAIERKSLQPRPDSSHTLDY